MRYRQIRPSRLRTQLLTSKEDERELKKIGPLQDPEREEILGLKFKKGDEVYDTVTKKGGKIIAGTTKSIAVSTPGGSRGKRVPGETS